MDVKAAYLYADFKETIYMKTPEGDSYYKKGFWKLRKTLYCLKQAAREWNNSINEVLKDFGFERLISEPCVFIKKEK